MDFPTIDAAAATSPRRLTVMSEACSNNPVSLLVGLADSLRMFFDECAVQVGLTPAQGHALMAIEGPTRMGDLAAQQTCDPSSVTSMIGRLERDGFVQRVVDPHDARARLVQLSRKGTATRARLATLLARATDVIDGLPAEQRAELAALFAPERAASAADSARR